VVKAGKREREREREKWATGALQATLGDSENKVCRGVALIEWLGSPLQMLFLALYNYSMRCHCGGRGSI